MKNKKLIICIICFTIIMIILIMAAVFCVIYIGKDNNMGNVDKISQIETEISNIPSFDKTNNMKIVNMDNVTDIFDIDKNMIKNAIGKLPHINISSSMYVILELNNIGEVEVVKEKLELYAKNYEKTWESYMEDQYNIVLNREIGSKEEYVYLIISDDKKDILEIINNIL